MPSGARTRVHWRPDSGFFLFPYLLQTFSLPSLLFPFVFLFLFFSLKYLEEEESWGDRTGE